MKFNSAVQFRGTFNANWSQTQIKNEPMLFNCDRSAAYELGGPITRAFLDGLPEDWQAPNPLIIDSRVHMLMKGWYPCIPGYHHDDVPRSTESGQPNYVNPEYLSEHLLGLVNGDICPTQFALGEIELDIPDQGIIYKQWHPKIVEAVETGQLESYSAGSGVYLQFDCETFHQGVAANKPGWRWFIRVSRNTDRVKSPTNELRRQVQVYLEHPMEGW